jgi:hypothetical protein
MKYALGNMLNGAGGLNADQLALDLPFAVTKSLTAAKGPTPTFTRASSGTFVGSNGLIQSAGNNVARFDHNPVTLACRGLLIEESRTNTILQSEDFSSASWNASSQRNLTVSVNNTTSPSGATDADKLTVGSTTTIYQVLQNTATLTSGTAYTVSCYFKAGEITRVNLYAGSLITLPASAIFNLTGSGSIIGTPTGTASIQQLQNGWYRCNITATAGASSSTSLRISPVSGTSTNYPGNSVDSFYAWGAQLEAGSFATSYIPTTAASVVRSADVCSISGAAFSGFWSNNEGSLFSSGDARTTATGVATYVMANSGANTNQVSIYRNSTTNFYGVANSGLYTANIQFASSNGSFNKIAGSYATNNARSAANGTLGTPDSTVTVPTNLTRLNIGSSGTGSQEFANGCIAAVRYYKKTLPNAKLQALTA